MLEYGTPAQWLADVAIKKNQENYILTIGLYMYIHMKILPVSHFLISLAQSQNNFCPLSIMYARTCTVYNTPVI